jgi:hypothetical protein
MNQGATIDVPHAVRGDAVTLQDNILSVFFRLRLSAPLPDYLPMTLSLAFSEVIAVNEITPLTGFSFVFEGPKPVPSLE